MFKRSLNIYLSLAVMGECLRMGFVPSASHVNSKVCQKLWQNLLLLAISLFSSSFILLQSQWFTDIALGSFYSFPVCLPDKESTGTAGAAFPSPQAAWQRYSLALRGSSLPLAVWSLCCCWAVLHFTLHLCHSPSIPAPLGVHLVGAAWPCVVLLSLWCYCSIHSNESGPLLKIYILASLNLNFVLQVHH